MKTLIALPRGAHNIVAVSGILAILEAANAVGENTFDLQVVSPDPVTYCVTERYQISVDACIADVKEADLILIPSLLRNHRDAVHQNEDLINWMKQMRLKQNT